MQRRRKKKSNKKIWISLLTIIGVSFFLYQNYISASIEIPNSPTVSETKSVWHIPDSPFRRQIFAGSTSSEIVFEINHAEMVIDGKSISSAHDLNIIAENTDDSKSLEFELKNPDDIKTLVRFRGDTNSSKYYIYYGNKIQSKSNLKTFMETPKTNASLDVEEEPLVSISLNKTWILKENSLKSIEGYIQTKINYTGAKIFAVINDNKDAGIEVGVNDSKFRFDSEKLKIGDNSIFIYFVKDSKIYKSNVLKFVYTAPVYVSWTMDWEGTAPDQKNLDAMLSVANDYSVPITHYFNPRVYIFLRTTDARRKEITDWMVKRLNAGDDIALHMHMQHDMVEEAGVKAKYNEKAWDDGVSGYDTPTTAYSYEEVKKILNWGKNTLEEKFLKFSNYKIPEIQGYRAGGWFADLDVLRAVQDAGFKYDSSGRVSFEIGKNKFKQPWDLFNTSQPYIPSKSDQNKTGTDNFDLIEIPNNGADSYWSSAQEMIANFNANFTAGEYLSQDKIVVYLSHPDWFNIDDPKLRELFREIGKFRNDRDLGPVKFVNMREYLEESVYIQSIKSSN